MRGHTIYNKKNPLKNPKEQIGKEGNTKMNEGEESKAITKVKYRNNKEKRKKS